MDLESLATPGYNPPVPESTTLTIRLANPQKAGATFVGWFSEDGKQFGLLDLASNAATPECWGMVPSKRIRVLALSTAASDEVLVEAPVDLADGRAQSVDLTLQEQHKAYTREITMADARRTPLARLDLDMPLDGSPEAARDALLNHGQLVTDTHGRVSVRLYDKRPVRLATTLPLASSPVVFDLLPEQNNVVLRNVVSCSFTCKDGSEAPHIGYLAIATLQDGTSVKHERPAEDVFQVGDEAFAWPTGATSIVVSSHGFTSARISSASARCHLPQNSDRNCDFANADRSR